MVIDTTICIEALTAWPVEARPKHVDRSHGRFFCTTLCESDMEDHHAIDLFIASGLRWLADNSNQHISVAHGYQTSNQWCVWYNDGDVNLGPTLLAAIDTAIRTIAAAARKGLQQRWIPVSERLPEKDLLVNVMQIDGAIGAGLIMESGSWWCIVPKTDTKDAPITHWQPLPEPPQALTDGGTGG